jgi:gamma-glutamylcyclotransferase (GGCT)/AIG2-like uncharacterized protein YtfP
MKDYLFAYGTLAEDTATPEIAATIKRLKLVGEGFVVGRLYDMGEYPGAVLGNTGDEKVFGKIFELDDNAAVLDRLDRYEGFDPQWPTTSLFVRKRSAINRANRPPLTGWVYEYNGNVKRAPVIKTGRHSKVSV